MDSRGLTLGELCELESRAWREGSDSLTPQERESLEQAAALLAPFFAVVSPALVKAGRDFQRLSPFERQAYPNLTPKDVLVVRRDRQVSQRRPQSRRPTVRRRECRARSRSPGRLDDDDPHEPDLVATLRGGVA